MVPIPAAFVVGQQRQPCLRLKWRAFQLDQGVFCAVEQARLEVIQRQGVLCSLAICQAQVAPRQQVFMNAHGTFIFAAPAKQVAQRKVQFRGVGVVLDRFNEGVDCLILLFIEQEIQTLEIGVGRLMVLNAQLAQIQAGGDPAQAECKR